VAGVIEEVILVVVIYAKKQQAVKNGCGPKMPG